MARLCRECLHCKSKRVGDVTWVYWCEISKKQKNGSKLGVHPWCNSPHPKCPVGVAKTHSNDENGKS